MLFSLRSGTCRLRIELGRHRRPKEKEEERLCLACDKGKVENEVHFVTECEVYAVLRQDLFSKILSISNGLKNLFEEDNEEEIFQVVMGVGWGGGDQWSKICQASLNFVYLAMMKRALLLKDRLV